MRPTVVSSGSGVGSSPRLRPGDLTPVIIAARRTPVATVGRAYAEVDAATLAGHALAAVADDLRRLRLPLHVDDVLLGNCRGPGGNLARVAALQAGLGAATPGVTVDRQCGSGQAAIQLAAAQIASGSCTLVLAGGVESASTQPVTMRGPVPYTRARFAPEGWPDPEMGAAAQAVADTAGVSRAAQDEYAVRSHALALASMASGVEDDEVVLVTEAATLRQDDRPRRLRPELLARFPGSFSPGGSVTAGNSCAISDGAAVVAIVPEFVRAELDVPGLAVRGWRVAGVDPATPGIGPVPAVSSLLADRDLRLADIDSLEIIEAFAGQVLACTSAWGLDPLGRDHGRVCRQGGAIARGHPWGASGALLLVRLFSQFVRLGAGERGVAAAAVGGGQGLAMLAERVG